MKAKNYLYILFPLTVVGIIFRVVELLYGVEAETGYYVRGSSLYIFFNIFILAGVIVLLSQMIWRVKSKVVPKKSVIRICPDPFSFSGIMFLLSAAGIIEKDLFGKNRVTAVRLWTVVIGLASASCVWISGDIIRWLLTGYSFFVPGIAAPMLPLVLGKLRKAEPRIWLTGAVVGGLCGLIGSLTGVTFWSFAGIAAAFLGSLSAIFRHSIKKPI